VGRPIRRVLIANRGEIAVRVNRSCRDLGIETVQVYSEADRESLAVKLADRAVCIGGPRSSESYLNQPLLVQAAVAFKADAVHPGYGFLSENADFAALCVAHGLTWIGPAADVIRLMGNKAAAREAAAAAGLRTTPGSKGSAWFTPDSKEVVYLDRGRVFNVTLEKREPKPIAVSAELDVDFSREKLESFRQAWTYLRDQFFDEQMNGVDWNAVRAAYEPRIKGARTPDEMRRIISLMLGELNASHMGISAPPGETQTATGRLVIDVDRAEYESAGRLRITNVVPLGPAALAGIKPGEYLVRVDGHAIGPRVNLDALLSHTIDRRVPVSVAAGPSATPRDIVVKPVNQTTEKGLRYRQWVEQRRDYVAKASGGRLGYVHMYDMSETALAQLMIDLDAENQSRDGVVIDVRNNNGGFVNVYAIDVLSRRGYFNMLRRGFETVSSRSLLGQRALERPTILVTNQHSLSDAEDFTEGYRTLKLGKVVGEPTAGWIIYTGTVPLIDGSNLRMPSFKIFASDGTPMEMHPRPVDVPVTRAVGESYSGKDVQLDTAVGELLKQIGPPRTRTTAQP